MVHVESAEPIEEHVYQAPDPCEGPVFSNDFDITEVDVQGCHDQWGRVEDHHVSHKEPLPETELSPLIQMEFTNDNWGENDPESEGASQVLTVCNFEPGKCRDIPVFGPLSSKHSENLRNDCCVP